MSRTRCSTLILLPCLLFAHGQQSAVPGAAQTSSQARQPDQPAASTAQSLIQQIEARRERGQAAPEGFEYFEGQGYRFLVPAPVELEGREGNQTKISVMGTRMLVLAGDPVQEDSDNTPNFEHLKNSSWQGQYTRGRKATFGKHSGWISDTRGNNYSGSTAIIFGKGRTIQITCVNQQEQLTTSGKASYKEQRLYLSRALAQAADRQNTEAMCQALFQSVELEEDGDDFAQPSALYNRDKAAQSAAVLQQASPEPAAPGGMSLGDLGRRQRAMPAKHATSFEAVGDPDQAPAGFRWLGLSEVCQPNCNRSRMLLPQAAVALPEYPEVFQMPLGRAVVSLFAGRLRTWSGVGSLPPSLWRQEKFAVPAFAIQTLNSPTITVLYEEEKSVNGQPAKISRVRLVDAAGNIFLGEGAVFKISGDIGIGCLIPENKFGEFEPVCARMIDSLQVE